MNTKLFFQVSAITFLAACNNPADNTKIKHPEVGNICEIVSTEKIKQAINSGSQQPIMLNIYPGKLTNDNSKDDFELLVLFHDSTSNQQVNLNGDPKRDVNNLLLNYVNFMYETNQPENKLAYGYYLTVDSLFAFSTQQLNVCVKPMNLTTWVCSDEEMEEPDSAGKCPPDCCPEILSRSTNPPQGVTTPETGIGGLLYSSFMKRTIADVYRKEKTQ